MMDLIGTILVGPKERGLERALKSLKACGCEAVHALIDTIDSRSADMLVKYGCAVFDREWDWEWGPARQFLQNTIPPGVRWQLWLDSDDEVPDSSAAAIRQLVQTPSAIVSMPYVYVAEDGKPYRSLYRLRMFPPGSVHWHLRAHEYATFQSGLRTLVLNIPIIHHWRAHDASRHIHYVEGLTKDFEERPNDPRVMFYLAQSQRDAGMVNESIQMYERYLASGGGWSQERMKACLMLSRMHQQRGALERALQAAQQAAEESDEERREVYQRIGEVHYALGSYAEAYGWFKRELEIPRPKAPLLYVCEDHYRERPFEWLVFACDKLGRNEEAVEYCKRILQMDPGDTNARYNMGVFANRIQRQRTVGDMPAPEDGKPLICFFAGPALERWSADSLEKGGIGGLETANVRMGWAFQKLGWEVALFANCAGGEHQGIKHVHYSRFHEYCERHRPDAAVISRHSDLVDRDFPAGVKVLWPHDLHFGDSPESSAIYLSKERIGKFNLIMFQSPYHQQLNTEKYGIPEEKQLLIRLGIDAAQFEKRVERNPRRCMYASSPDRGLPRLLEFWPEIRRAVPDAELHVFYGFGNYLGRFVSSPEPVKKRAQAWVDELKTIMEELPGVEYRGRVGQAELAEEFLMSAVWAYPTNFQETLCITALTACAAGCVPLATDLAALHTTVGEYGILLEGDADKYEYRERFVTELVRLLTDADYWKRWSEIARRNVYDRKNDAELPYWSWDAIAGEIDRAVRSRLPQPREKKQNGVFVELGAGEHPTIDERSIIHTDLAAGIGHIECRCDNGHLPFRDGSLAGVIMNQVLEHSGWRETQRVLEECWSALAPGGRISLSVPDFFSQAEQFVEGRKGLCRILDMVFASQSRPENVHRTAFTLASLRSALARAGFSVRRASVNSGESELTTWDSLSAEAVKPERDKRWMMELARQKLGTDGEYPTCLYNQDSGWWRGYPWELKARVQVHRAGQSSPSILSVIVIAHGQKEERTVKCVERLRAVLSGFPYELVGVDDGSSDGTFEFFVENADVAVQIPERRGICEAYNAGIAASGGPMLLLVQNDLDMQEEVVPRMYEFLMRHPDMGIVSPMLEVKRYKGEMENGFIILPPYPENGGSAWDAQIPAGPCIMMRRRDLVRAGLFDPYLFNMWADHDVGRAVADLGLRTAVMSEPILGYFPGNVSILEAQLYTERERLRRFMSAYYFHLKWGYDLDGERLMSVQV